MTRRMLILALINAGLVAAATSVAFSLYPQNWFTKDTPANTSTSSATALAPVPAGITALPLPPA